MTEAGYITESWKLFQKTILKDASDRDMTLLALAFFTGASTMFEILDRVDTEAANTASARYVRGLLRGEIEAFKAVATGETKRSP